MEFIESIKAMQPAILESGEPDTTNLFSFFCPFCLAMTTFENSGNFAMCQSCQRLGTNYWKDCQGCNRGKQYCYVTEGM